MQNKRPLYVYVIAFLIPYDDGYDDSDNDSEKYVIGYVENAGKILPMDTQKIASVQQASI